MNNLALVLKARGGEHPDVVTDMENLVMSFRKTGGFEEAEALLLAALELNRKAKGPDDPRVARTRRKLVRFYEDWGRPEEAARYLTR